MGKFFCKIVFVAELNTSAITRIKKLFLPATNKFTLNYKSKSFIPVYMILNITIDLNLNLFDTSRIILIAFLFKTNLVSELQLATMQTSNKFFDFI